MQPTPANAQRTALFEKFTITTCQDSRVDPYDKTVMNSNDLIESVKMGDKILVESLLEKGVDPNEADEGTWTPLHWAAQECFCDIARCLIAFGANVNARDKSGITPLANAVGPGHTAFVKLLIKNGASPNQRIAAYSNGTVMHLACSWNRIEIVKLLVTSASTEINIRNEEGKTPLGFSMDGGFNDLSEYLVAHGAVA